MNTQQNSKSYQITCSIDFGTTFSGFAYAHEKDKDRVLGFYDYEENPYQYSKTETSLLYSNGKITRWGYPATHNREEGTLLKKFKLLLENPDFMLLPGSLTTLDVISEYLKNLFQLALKTIQSHYSFIKNKDVRWCLTVPAIWTENAKLEMRKAAKTAGMLEDDEDIMSRRLLIILEPEAAALYSKTKLSGSDKPKNGECYIMIDAGGGTIDLISHVVQRKGETETLKEVTRGSGSLCGGVYVDQEFFTFIRKKMGEDVFNQYQKENPECFSDLWFQIKKSFDVQTGNKRVAIPAGLYNKISDAMKSQLEAEQKGNSSDIILTNENIKNFFKNSLEGIKKLTDEQLLKIEKEGYKCTKIIFVGGLGGSPYLKNSLSTIYSPRGIRVITPADPGSAVVQGAVLYGLNPEAISERRMRYTYGIETCCINTEEHPEHLRFWSGDHQAYYTRKIFSKFVTINQSISCNESIKHTFYPMEKNQTGVTFQVYSGDSRDPKTVEENGVELLGKFVLDSPDTSKGLNRQFEVEFFFGMSEIFITAIDLESGKTNSIPIKLQ